MTKLRAPVSIELAITRAAAILGWEQAASVADQAERTVRNWSDPDTQAEISLKAAVRLDAACMAADGIAPFRETYQLLLDGASAEASADLRRLAENAATVAKEAGEAVSSMIMAARPGASETDRLVAARDAEEAIVALSRTLPDLRRPESPP